MSKLKSLRIFISSPLLIILLLHNLDPARTANEAEEVDLTDMEDHPDIPYFDCAKKSLAAALDDYGEKHASMFSRSSTGACTSDFLYCTEGIALPATCPSGLFFNSKNYECDLKENVEQCLGRSYEVTGEVRYLLADVPFHDCARKPCGFYPNEKVKDGSSFIFCKEGTLVEKPCPEGSAYDYKVADCVNKEDAAIWKIPANLIGNMSKDHPLRQHDTGGVEGVAPVNTEGREKFVPVYQGVKGFPPPASYPTTWDFETSVATIQGGAIPDTEARKTLKWNPVWTEWLLCPDLSFFVGFNGSDGLECMHPGAGGNSKFILEFPSEQWNYLKDAVGDPGSVINGLSVGPPKKDDDGKAENLVLHFSNKPTKGVLAGGGVYGVAVEGEMYCPLKTGGCGLSISYNTSGEGDGYSILNARIECCPVPSPFEEPGYIPVEYIREVVRCDNRDSDSWKKCEFTLGIWGIVVPDELLHVGSFYASVGYTLDDIYKSVEKRIREKGVKCGGDDDGDEAEPAACWYDDWKNLVLESARPIKVKRMESVPPFTKLILYQAYAQVGYMRIFSTKFLEVIETDVVEYPQSVEVPVDDVKANHAKQNPPKSMADREPIIAEQLPGSSPYLGEDKLLCKYHSHESTKKVQREGLTTVILSTGDVTVTGKWQKWSNCSGKGYAIDRIQFIKQDVKLPNGKVDKAGVVQLGATCKDLNLPQTGVPGGEVTHLVPGGQQKPWDDSKWRVCQDGVAVGFQILRVSRDQAEDDDVGMETIKIICSCPSKEHFWDNRGEGIESGRGYLGMGGYAEIVVRRSDGKVYDNKEKPADAAAKEEANDASAGNKKERVSKPARTEGLGLEKGKKVKAPRQSVKKGEGDAKAPEKEQKTNWAKRKMPGIPRENRTKVANIDAENQKEDDALTGHWIERQICKPEQALVGIRPKFLELRKDKDSYDNKGLMSFKAKCLDIPNHSKICEPKEKKVLVAKCKNTRSTEAPCKFKTVLGVTYDFADENIPVINIIESVGASLACVLPDLKDTFDTKLGTTNPYWSDSARGSFWNTLTKASGQIAKLKPGAAVEIIQTVGTCGPYVVYSNLFAEKGADGEKPFALPPTATESLSPSVQQCWRDTEPIKMKPSEQGIELFGKQEKTEDPLDDGDKCEFTEDDPTDEYTETDGGTILTSPQITQNGFWGDDQHEHHPKEAKNGWYVCSDNTFINGIIVQRYAEGDDHFGIAHLAFKCIFPENGTRSEQWVMKTPGLTDNSVRPLGTWNECKESAVAIGFQLNSQSNQGDEKDDVATDNVKLDCSCGFDALDDMSEDPIYGSMLRGDWTTPRICQPKQALCGFQGQFQHYYRKDEQEEGLVYDNTGLNNLKGKCCDVKHPAEKCAPEEKKILIGTCDNTDDWKERACEIVMNVGVKLDEAQSSYEKKFYEGIGFTKECTGNLLRPRFQNNVKCTPDKSGGGEAGMVGSACLYDWTTAPHQVWVQEDSFHDNAMIRGNAKVNIYQIVGKCGNYLVMTNRYMVEDVTRDLVDLTHPHEHASRHNKKCWEDDKHIKSKSTGTETLQPDKEKRTFDLSTNNLTVYEVESDGTVITSPVPTDFPEISNYSDWQFCKKPEHTDSWYVDAIYVERQGTPAPDEDLAGLVAVAFRCGNTKRIGRGDHVITGITPGAPVLDEGAWDWKTCKCGSGVGFQVSAVPTQLLGDDLGVESMKLKCSCGETEWIWKTQGEFPSLLTGLRGIWTGEQLCRPREAICGVNVRSKPFQLPSEKEQSDASLSHYDNMGITRIKVKCCSVPNPAIHCEPRESIKEIAICDNTEQDVKKRCKVETIVGVTYDIANLENRNEADFYESIGWTLNCIVDELEDNFVEKFGKSNVPTDYLWQGAREIWTVAQPIVDFIDMDERSKSTIHQVIGECGPYVIATDRFLRRDSNLKSNEDDVDEEFYDTKATVKPLHRIKPGCWAEMGRFQARDYIFPNASNEISYHRLPTPTEFTTIVTPTKTGIVIESPATKKLLRQGMTEDVLDDSQGRIQKKECPDGSYMTGYAVDNSVVKVEVDGQTTQDDLGLSHMMIRCRQPDRSTKAKGLSVHDTSTEINVNKLRNLHMPCIGGLLVGFQVNTRPPPERGDKKIDKFGIDNIRMVCSWGPPLQNLQPVRTPWTENPVVSCRPYQALCELTAVFGPKSVGNWEKVDGTGITQIKMTCCDVPNPVVNAEPKEILRLSSVCDNTQYTEDRICDYSMDLGVTYDFQEHWNEAVSYLSIGYTIPCVITTVKNIFVKITSQDKKIECAVPAEEGICAYDWAEAVDHGRIFQAGISTYSNFTIVKGFQRIDLYQVVGKVNNLLVLTNHFVLVTKTVDGKVLSRDRMVVELGHFPSLDVEDFGVCNLTNTAEQTTPDITREETPLSPKNEMQPTKKKIEPAGDGVEEGLEMWEGDEIERVKIPETPADFPSEKEEAAGTFVSTPEDEDGWEIFMDAEVDGERPWLPLVACEEGLYITQLLPELGDGDNKPMQGVRFKCADPSGKEVTIKHADSKLPEENKDKPEGLGGRSDMFSHEVCICPGIMVTALPFGIMTIVQKDKSGGFVQNSSFICSCNGRDQVTSFRSTLLARNQGFNNVNISVHQVATDDNDEEAAGGLDLTEIIEVESAPTPVQDVRPEKIGKLPPGNQVLKEGDVRKLALYCPPRKALCGVRIQAKHKKKGGVQRMQLHCCEIVPPTEECKTEDKLVKAATCDNLFNQLERVCEFSMYIGMTYNFKEYDGFRRFYERSRWNANCVNDRLAGKFAEELGETKSLTPFNWDSSAKEVPLGQEWQDMKEAIWNMTLTPMTKLEIFQTVGRCGMYAVYTNEAYLIDTNSETGEIKKYSKQLTFGEEEGQLKLAPGQQMQDALCWAEVVPITAVTPILTENEPPAGLVTGIIQEKTVALDTGMVYENLRGPAGIINFHGFPATDNGANVYPADEKEDVTGVWFPVYEGNPEDEPYNDEDKIICKEGTYIRRYGAFPSVDKDAVLNAIYFMCTKPDDPKGTEYKIIMDKAATPPEEKYTQLASGVFIGMHTKPKGGNTVSHMVAIGSIRKILPPPELGYDKKEYCPPGQAMCGMKASWGSAGCKNAKFLCCCVDSPALSCLPKEKLVKAAICDNRDETRKRRCSLKLGAGIMYHIKEHPLSSYFHGSIGYTAPCIADDLKSKYQLMKCPEGEGCQYDWGSAPAEVFKQLEVVPDTTDVEPGQIVEYRQQIGACHYDGGEILILTTTLRRVVLDSGLKELSNDPYLLDNVPNKDVPAVCPYKFMNLTVPPTPSPIIDENPILQNSVNMPENDTSLQNPYHGMAETDLIEFVPGEADSVIIPGPIELELDLNLETSWREWVNCSKGKIVNRLEVYSGGIQGEGTEITFEKPGEPIEFTDPMGMVTFVAQCTTPKLEEPEEIKLISTPKDVPAERVHKQCATGAVSMGFETKFKRYESPPANNQAYLSLKLLCSYGEHLSMDTDSEWEGAVICRPREAICGFLIESSDFQVGQPVEIHDNVGISSMKAKCCPVHTPVFGCEARETREEAITCDNTGFDNDRQCIAQLFVGLSYVYNNPEGEKPAYYESTGWTLDCIKEELSARFSSVIGSTPDFDWTGAVIKSTTDVLSNKIWYRVVQQEQLFDVPKKSGFKLLQIVGTCGIYKVHTNKFIKVNLDTNEEEQLVFDEMGNKNPPKCWADITPLKGRNWILIRSEKHPPAILRRKEFVSSKENVFRFDPPDGSNRKGMMAKMPVEALPAERWSQFVLCPVDSFIRSIAVKKSEKKVEPKTDIIGVVAISFQCMLPNMTVTREVTLVHPSFKEEMDEWRSKHLGKHGSRYQTCIGGTVGVEIEYMAVGASGDDNYGIYDTRWLCGVGRDTNFVRLPDHTPVNPHLSKGLVCRPRQSLCSLHASFAPAYKPAVDNMGITNYKIACCPVPSPIESCKGTDVLTYAVTCDNTKYNRERKCKFNVGFGIQYDLSKVHEKASIFYLSVGYTPSCLASDLRDKFRFWGDNVPDQFFQELVAVQRVIDVPAKSRVDIYQIVGICNMIQILTAKLLLVTLDANGTEVARNKMTDKNLPPYESKACEFPPETGELEPPVMPPPEMLKNLDSPKRPTHTCLFKDRLDAAIYTLSGDGSNFIEGTRELNIERNHKMITWAGYNWQNCSKGNFFTGVTTHSGELEVPIAEGDLSQGKRTDSYGIDAVAIQCGNPLKGTPEEILELHSTGSPVSLAEFKDGGKLKNGKYCDAGAAIGFTLGIRPFQKTGDDESIDSFRLHCSCGKDMIDGKAATLGEGYTFWTEPRFCRPKEALCGFTVQAQEIASDKTVMTHDNIGIANIRTKCCTVPSPLPDLTPEEKLVLVAKCDNKAGHEMKRCVVDLFVGLGYTYSKEHLKQIYFYDTVGYTLNVLRKEIAEKFGTQVGATERFDWSQAVSSTIWNRLKDRKENFTATIGVEIQLLQVVGVAGFFKIRTNKFILREINTHTNTEKEIGLELNDIANPLSSPSWEMTSPIRGRDWMITWSTPLLKWTPRDQYPVPTKLETLDKIQDALNEGTLKYGMIIQTPNPLLLGYRWDDWKFCPNGTFVRAWTSVAAGKMVQGDEGADDYSGTVLIKAICQSPDLDPSQETEILILQPNNGWENEKWSQQGRIPLLSCIGAGIGLQGKIQNVPKPSEDQFFFHDTKLVCSSGQDAGFMRDGPYDTPCEAPMDEKYKHRTSQVEANKQEICNPRQSVCGVRVSWGSNNIGNFKVQDGVGVTNLLGLCCDVPSPVSNCKKSVERIVFASACDNSRGSVPRRCMFNLVIGIAYDYYEDESASYFYASNGFTPTCITAEVKQKYQSMPPRPCGDEGCNYEWTEAPIQIWQETITISQMKDVEAFQRFRIYQVIGECDSVTVLTNQFIQVVADKDENELSREVWRVEDLPPPKQKKCEVP